MVVRAWRQVWQADHSLGNVFEATCAGHAAEVADHVQSEQFGILATSEYDTCGTSCSAKL